MLAAKERLAVAAVEIVIDTQEPLIQFLGTLAHQVGAGFFGRAVPHVVPLP